MIDRPITIAGIPIPTSNPVFLAVLAFHVGAGLLCVVAGIVAMFSRKGRGRHSRAGTVYYRSLIVVFTTMSILAAMRWPHDIHLFVLGLLSLACAVIARRVVTYSGAWRIRAHIAGMGSSYILLLVAFYVDNGPNLPGWRSLPSVMYWLLPTVVGLPLIARAVLRHPLAKAERERTTNVHPPIY